MLRGSLVFATMLAAASIARAEPSPRAQALALADDSERAYKAGQFEKAAALLRKAHDKYPEPILLYNLGRALEGMGDTKGAIDAYEQYLHDAKQIDDRPAIERRIATLKGQLEKARQDEELKAKQAQEQKEQKEQAEKDRLAAEQAEKDRVAAEQAEKDRLAREQATQPPPPPPPTQPQLPPPPPPTAERSTVEIYGPWATLGAGGALIVTGALFGWRSGANHDDAVNEPVQLKAQDLQSSAQTDATIANVMFVVGGAAAIGGAVWEYFAWKHGRESATASTRVKVAPSGVAVEWTW